ncbi:MAG: DUF4270 domain-containing protein [Bacteroidales bacterium]|nr:DUF4270 domain-containing protein [Bacteroidales bacterium]
MIKIMWGFACSGSFLVLLWLASCGDNSSLGNYLVETHTRTYITDTFTVRLSVLSKDSIVTSTLPNYPGVAFVGEYDDPLVGKSTAATYIEFTRTTDDEPNDYPKFDSVVLIMRLTGNYYGDTLVYPDVKISRLARQIEMDNDGVQYASSTMPLGNEVPVVHRFRFKGPHAQKEIAVRLPNEFGEQLFTGIRKEMPEMSVDNYLKTFPGLAIEPRPGNNCIYTYSVEDTTCRIQIHYTISTGTDIVEKVMTFNANKYKQFNHLTTQLLPDLPRGSKAAPVGTGKTRHRGFVMTGAAPLYTRIDFPGIERLPPLGELVVIEQANLIIRPVVHTYDTVPLPPTLNLYQHNSTNNLRGSVLSATGTSTAMNGNLNQNGGYYNFDITDYITSQVSAVGYDRFSICLDFPESTSSDSYPFQRMVFGDQNFFHQSPPISAESQISLQITYSIYNEY